MMSKKVLITNKLGLHARAAAKLVHLASRFGCEIKLTKDHHTVNGKSIMGVMMLAAHKGVEIELSCDGDDEEQALYEVEQLINTRFGEQE